LEEMALSLKDTKMLLIINIRKTTLFDLFKHTKNDFLFEKEKKYEISHF